MAGRMSSKMKSKRSAKLDNDKLDAKHTDEHDSSLLSKPVATSVTGLAKALKIFQAATDEVQNYLTYECDIIYECRVCRSIFRSLFNFIMHKRSYCNEKFCHLTQGNWARNNDDDYLDVIYRDQSDGAETDKVDKEVRNKSSKKKLSSIVEELAQKKQIECDLEKNTLEDQYEKINKDYMLQDSETERKTLNIETIDGTSSGVFMTFGTQPLSENRLEKTKVEVMELQSMLEGQSAILGPDGKVLNTSQNHVFASKCSAENARLTCNQCNINFATRKTLLSHTKYKHESSRIVYPCLECSDTFASVWSVYRHLYGVHRKTGPQVRKMRAQIQAKAYRKDQAPQKKSPDHDKLSKSSLNEQQKIDEENQAWMDNLETDNDMQMCGGCGRRFERKAALNAHSQTCQKRIAARNIIHVNRQKRAINATDDKQTDKKNAKILKLGIEPEKKQLEKSKLAVGKKRKIGIQIRYDYTKSTEKTNLSPVPTSNVPEDVSELVATKNNSSNKRISAQLENDTTPECSLQLSANNSSSMNSATVIPDNKVIYSTIVLSPNKEDTNIIKSNNNSEAELIETDVLSIPSSNSPHKEDQDPLSLRDTPSDTDSEIEEILGPCAVTILTEDNISRNGEYSDKEGALTECEDTRIEQYKEPNINENTLKLLQLINSNVPTEISKRTLDGRMGRHVSLKKLQCVPCDIKFSNISKLRCHMALHFNWMRFRCDICSFKAYDKIHVTDHVKEIHNIQEWEKIEAVILQIPEWESAEMSSEDLQPIVSLQNITVGNTYVPVTSVTEKKTDAGTSRSATPEGIFIKSNEKYITKSFKTKPIKKLKGAKTIKIKRRIDEVILKDVQSQDPLGECNTIPSVQTKPTDSDNSVSITESKSSRDNAIKKMVYEVIFGKDLDLSKPNTIGVCEEDKNNCVHVVSADVSNVISRPVRNRAKPLNKDFIYDLHEFKEQTKTVSPSSNNRNIMQSVNKCTESLEELHSYKQTNRKRVNRSPKNNASYSRNMNNTVKQLNLQKRSNDIFDSCANQSLTGDGTFAIDNVTVIDPKGFLNDSNTFKSDDEDDDIYIVENEELVAVK